MTTCQYCGETVTDRPDAKVEHIDNQHGDLLDAIFYGGFPDEPFDGLESEDARSIAATAEGVAARRRSEVRAR